VSVVDGLLGITIVRYFFLLPPPPPLATLPP
jgi:hypothetical protein